MCGYSAIFLISVFFTSTVRSSSHYARSTHNSPEKPPTGSLHFSFVISCMAASRPIPIRSTSPRGPMGASSSGAAVKGATRVSQSLPPPKSPHFGSVKAPPSLVEAMPSLQLPQSSIGVVVARSLPAGEEVVVHSLRVSSKLEAATILEEADENQHHASLGQSLVSALSSLRIRNAILEQELDLAPKPPLPVVSKPPPPASTTTTTTRPPLRSRRRNEDEDDSDLDEDDNHVGETDEELQFELS
jgi:hypothetical protein